MSRTPTVRALLVSLLLAASFACSKDTPAPAAHEAPATVEQPKAETDLTTVTLTPQAIARLGIRTEAASVQPAAGTRTVGGEVVVPEGRRVQVTAPVAGVLSSATVRAGATVAAGALLFRLTPVSASERDQGSEARRALDTAQAEEQVARQRVQRLEQLLKDGATSLRAVEDARAQLGIATAALTGARERLSSIGPSPPGQRGEMTIAAPLSGTVLTVSAAEGQTVAAAAPLAEIAQAAPLWVRVPIYAGDAESLDMTQPAAISRLGSTATTPGRRIAAPPSATPSAASVDVYFEIGGDGARFQPGERVTVQLPLRGIAQGLAVPAAALLYDINGGTWVYEDLGGGAYARRRVEVARHAGNVVLITRGIAAGTPVVTDGAAELFGTEFGAGH